MHTLMYVYVLYVSAVAHAAALWHCDSAVDPERLSEGRGRIRALQSAAHF